MRSILVLCKIICYFAAYDGKLTKKTIEYVREQIFEEKARKKTIYYFNLYKYIFRIQDNFSPRRRMQLMACLIQAMNTSTSATDIDELVRFLKRMLKSSEEFQETLVLNENYKIAATAIQDYVKKKESSMTEARVSPQLEAFHKSLTDFSIWLESYNEDPYTKAETDSESEPEFTTSKYHRGQRVRYYEPIMKEYLNAIVENTYENVVKVRLMSGNKQFIDYLEDDSSNLQPFEEEQVINANHNDTTPTGDGGSDVSYNSPRIA